ncbi:hypothetical protein RclHR1_23230001 [Rhizophagus clarus]|uniref:Uncharacterized protein n=1 Tax=Rhizophagus clarus TaxID=94130 RepID=A0A2Z6R964_9GLOM|nr:hypothetical protein RclHR1_23230001 [Rhizophagus clarus]
MVDHKDIELAQVKVIKTALRKGKKYDNLAKNYGDYLKKLRAEKDLNNYIKKNAVKIFPNEEAYTLRLENYPNDIERKCLLKKTKWPSGYAMVSPRNQTIANTLTLNCLVIPSAEPESVTRHSITMLKISTNETVD